jgi:hypothetical protein
LARTVSSNPDTGVLTPSLIVTSMVNTPACEFRVGWIVNVIPESVMKDGSEVVAYSSAEYVRGAFSGSMAPGRV